MGPDLYRLLAFVLVVVLIFWLCTLGERRKPRAQGGKTSTSGGPTAYVCPTCERVQQTPGKCDFCSDETRRAA